MSEMPKRVWVWGATEEGSWMNMAPERLGLNVPATPYVRADIADDLLAAVRSLLALHIAHHNAPEHAAARNAIAKAEAP